ncbi:type IV pilin-like G/H family protein [Rivularia sp. UHCC 0363]|uniref:type IV pilin-like G/H family protein n=1 Tax=Rivularia sp. UHCC 0363 TaxID=3110244 RepID=UPI002B1EACC2|nr:type IV pilin-like G/H family protein [Rivularia sp. UHCC 0363]MEA5594797.1 type IV pilin-like G/H family protein [Rivularia sp. UHCC 0363]
MSQQNILELAKQGDAQAIASLMNRQLQPKGITAKATVDNSCLQIMLLSDETLNQQALVEFIRKGLTGLKIISIGKVKIFAKKIGEDFPAWSQDLIMRNGSQFEIVTQIKTSQESLKEQAKLGDTNAISSLLNQSLKSKKVTVKTSLKGDSLNVMLESDDIPNEACVTLVRREVVMLKSTLINKIHIYAKQHSSDFPAWSKEINLSEQSYSTQPIATSSKSNSNNISITINDKTINLNDIESLQIVKALVIAGAVLLAIGVFCPIISAPIIGTLNYFHNGNGDGVILLILSAISIFLVLKHEFRYLWWTGFASLGVTILGFLGFQWKLSEIKSSMESELQGNPFRGLADATVNSIQLQWGWLVILLGIGLILAGVYFYERQNINKSGYVNYLLDLVNFRKSKKAYFFAGLVVIGLILPKVFVGIKAQAEYREVASKAKQSEAKTLIGSINRGQQVILLEKDRFSNSITELELGIASETDNYNYNITKADTSSAIATATAKGNGMKSYTGAVFMVKDSEYDFDTTKAVICETNSASKTPPDNPQLVGEDIQCAKGSKKLD